MTTSSQSQRNYPDKGPTAQKIFSAIDKIIRGIALVSLIPFLIFVFVLSCFASDSPSTGVQAALTVLGVGVLISVLILFSSLKPEMLSKPFFKPGKISLVIG